MTRFLVLAILFFSTVGRGDVESTMVLPVGVWSPKFIFGVQAGLDEKYNSVGLIEGVADQYHFDMTGSALAKLDPKLSQLVNILNGYAPAEHLGDALTLGTLDFKAAPEVTYFAPTLSYGLTKNISVGIGVPIIHYHNTMQVVSSGGNAQALAAYVAGSNSQVTDAMNQLIAAANNISGTINALLVSKGYQPLREVDFTAPGDMQVSALYRYHTDRWWKLALRPYVQLPTGHKHDAGDVMDVATGGQPALGLYSIHDLVFSRSWSVVSSLGYQANIQDSVDARVPNGHDDFLPGPDRDEIVRRKTGNSFFLETGASFSPWRALEIRALYDFMQKDPDWYDGDHTGWDYGLLGNDTGSQTHTLHGLIELSSIDWFQRKLFAVPFMFGYLYGNTIYAVNAPNQISHQLYLRMFF